MRSHDRRCRKIFSNEGLASVSRRLPPAVAWSAYLGLAAGCGNSATSADTGGPGSGGFVARGGPGGVRGGPPGVGSGGAFEGPGSSAGGANGSAGSDGTAGSPVDSGGRSGIAGTGGRIESGGSQGDGGAGTDGGNADTGGASAGPGGSGAGGVATTCPLPTTFKWTSTGPLASPKSPPGHDFVSLKDFTCVHWNDLFHVYATVFDQAVNGWNMVYLNFSDWSEAGAASQFYMQNSPTHGGVAPQLFYFNPKKEWVLVYQWGATYSTSSDPGQPTLWSPGKSLLTGGPPGGIDYSVICDGQSCYLFFAGDNGNIYQSKMPIGEFPGAFSGYTTLLTDSTNALFESPRAYSIQGTNQFLLIVEAIGGGGRYFRSFTATNLEGPWTPYAASEQQPFAGKANVTFTGNAWTNDISHGDVVRNDPSETMPIDACSLQLVYQGFDKTAFVSNYSLIPYRMALLTLAP
jgi:hypothetical protein